MEKEAYTIADFCRSYGIGMTKVYALIKARELRARKVGSKTLILRGDAEAWAAALPEINAAS